jgi:predicted RNase H-like HicB family nuclease
MRYAIIIEQAENNYSAFVPDLPGCVSVGDTLEEVKENIQEAISFHLESLLEEGLTIPLPKTECDYVEVAA